jgi:hypothetical protein
MEEEEEEEEDDDDDDFTSYDTLYQLSKGYSLVIALSKQKYF